MTTLTARPLTTTQAADRAGVHPDTIRRWVAAGLLACTRTPGGQRRIAPADLDALVRTGR